MNTNFLLQGYTHPVRYTAGMKPDTRYLQREELGYTQARPLFARVYCCTCTEWKRPTVAAREHPNELPKIFSCVRQQHRQQARRQETMKCLSRAIQLYVFQRAKAEVVVVLQTYARL